VCMLVYMHTCMNKETMKHRHLHEYFPWANLLHPRDCDCDSYCVGLWLCAPRYWSRTHKHDSFAQSSSRFLVMAIRIPRVTRCEWRWRSFATGFPWKWPRYIHSVQQERYHNSGVTTTTTKCHHRSTERALTLDRKIGRGFFQALYQ
jgi:hypothetical protein